MFRLEALHAVAPAHAYASPREDLARRMGPVGDVPVALLPRAVTLVFQGRMALVTHAGAGAHVRPGRAGGNAEQWRRDAVLCQHPLHAATLWRAFHDCGRYDVRSTGSVSVHLAEYGVTVALVESGAVLVLGVQQPYVALLALAHVAQRLSERLGEAAPHHGRPDVHYYVRMADVRLYNCIAVVPCCVPGAEKRLRLRLLAHALNTRVRKRRRTPSMPSVSWALEHGHRRITCTLRRDGNAHCAGTPLVFAGLAWISNELRRLTRMYVAPRPDPELAVEPSVVALEGLERTMRAHIDAEALATLRRRGAVQGQSTSSPLLPLFTASAHARIGTRIGGAGAGAVHDEGGEAEHADLEALDRLLNDATLLATEDVHALTELVGHVGESGSDSSSSSDEGGGGSDGADGYRDRRDADDMRSGDGRADRGKCAGGGRDRGAYASPPPPPGAPADASCDGKRRRATGV